MAQGAAPPAPGEPYVRIVEQPASKALRFRYECEGRSAGSIPGVNSTSEHRTYPTIEVVGYTGKAIIVVSCVTRDEPYRPHPHNLVGRERCRHGVCTVKQDLGESARVSFTNLGIQCVKRRDIADALAVREAQRVDPFRTGFGHKQQPQSIDLNAVRLCFQVFLLNEVGKHTATLRPVVSEVIYDKKAMSDLQILRISRPSGPAIGGTEVILLCEKVTREDISVVVCEENATGVVWEESGNIIVVHKQVAIAFTTPPYREPRTNSHVNVSIQLKRVSDGARSNSVQFQYIPEYQDSDYLRRKRQKPNTTLGLLERIEQVQKAAGFMPQPEIKTEPSGGSPLHRYTPVDQPDMFQQQWLPEMQGMVNVTSPSVVSPSHPQHYYGHAQAQAQGQQQAQAQQQPGWPQPAYGQTLVQPLQMPLQSRSPIHQLPVTSPGLHTMSPMQQATLHTLAPMQQQMSPMHQQAMSPQAMHQQSMSPMHQKAMSPLHQQAMSPLHQQANQQGLHQQANHQGMHQQGNHQGRHQQANHQTMNQQAMSPIHSQANHQAMSPLHQQASHQAMSPLHQQANHQAMSPLHQQANHQAMSPMQSQTNQQAMSPMHQQTNHHNQQAMSQQINHQAMSPLHQQAMSPLHQQAVSPGMPACGSPHLNMEVERAGVSPVMGQMTNVGIPSMVPQAQEGMESSGNLSLNNLLSMDAGAPIQLNSGDLSNLSALLGQYRSNELSDSLNRLSTTDLLNPNIEQH